MDYYSEPARTEMVSKDGFQPQYRRFSQRPPLAVGIPFPDLATVRYSRQVCRQHCGDLKPCGLSGPADAAATEDQVVHELLEEVTRRALPILGEMFKDGLSIPTLTG